MKYFKKCGEILVDVKSKDKINKMYVLHCSFCNVEFHQLEKFYLHIENHLNYSEGILNETEIEVKLEPEEDQVEVKLEREEIETEIFTAIEKCDVKLEPYSEEFINEPCNAVVKPNIKLHSSSKKLNCQPFTKIKIPNIKAEASLAEAQIDELIEAERKDLNVFPCSAEKKTHLYTNLLSTFNTVNDGEGESDCTGLYESHSVIYSEEDMESVISISDSDEQGTEGEYFSRTSPAISSMFGSDKGDDAEDFIYSLHIANPYMTNHSSHKSKSKQRKNSPIITSAERQRQYRQRLKLDKARYEAYRIRERERKRAYRKQFKQRHLYNK